MYVVKLFIYLKIFNIMILKNQIQNFLKKIKLDNLVQNFELFDNLLVLNIISDSPALHKKKKLENIFRDFFKKEYGEKLNLKFNIIIKNNINYQDIMKNNIKSSIKGINNIIAVSSTKGGVGKSTIAANIVLVLAQMGFNVGLLDSDIYGPSIPIMFNVVNYKPDVCIIEGKNQIKPIEHYGVKLLSIGFFVKNSQAVVWRGPMATKALVQMLREAYWGELDFLVLDLPPGTGDIHLSIVQEIPLTGVVVVSTPQFVALEDVKKGIQMFQMGSINVPILGIIQNMAYFTPLDYPNNKYYIFGKEGVRNLSKFLKIPFLGEIPIIQDIRKSADDGVPIVLQNKLIANTIFKKIVQNILEQLLIRNTHLPPTEIVKITNMSGCFSKKN